MLKFTLSVVACLLLISSSVSSEPASTKSATITCNTTTETTVGWKFTSPDGVTSMKVATDLTITVSASGVYTCMDGSNNTISTHTFLGKPKIQNTRESVAYHNTDMDRKLKCLFSDSSSYSTMDVAFAWQFKCRDESTCTTFQPLTNNTLVVSGEQSVDVQIVNTRNYSELSFGNDSMITYNHAGFYKCVVSSAGAESKEVEVLVRVQDKLAALWPFLGIVAEVLILIAIIFMYEHNSTKKGQAVTSSSEPEERQALKNLDSKQDEEVEVRQRPASQ